MAKQGYRIAKEIKDEVIKRALWSITETIR